MAGDRQRGLAVEVLLDQRQREVHAGGHARRGPHRPSRTKIGSGSTLHQRIAARELRGRRPVRGRAAPVQHARGREHERPGAHRATRRARGAGGGSTRSARGLAARSAPAPPATISVSILAGAWPRSACGTIVRPLDVAREAPSGLTTLDVVTALATAALEQLLRPAEHLQRPGHIQALDARVDEDHDIAWGAIARHDTIVTHIAPVRKDRFPTIPAITRCASGNAGARSSARAPLARSLVTPRAQLR